MTFGQQASQLAGLAARLLGWSPDEFWHATPTELAAAIGHGANEPVAEDELARLMAQFPDEAK